MIQEVTPKGHGNARNRFLLLSAAISVLCVAAALLWPAARESAKALANALFAASEVANAYAYDRFVVPAGTGMGLALVLLGIASAGILGFALLSRSGTPALLIAAMLAGVQAYFGLSLPAAANVLIFASLSFVILAKRASLRTAAVVSAAALIVALAVLILAPGTNAAIEAASETARDWLGAAGERETENGGENMPERMETRHENRRDFIEGDVQAQSAEAYRLVTALEQQISRPHWVDVLRIVLLCLLIPVALIVPFVPFLWLNRQAKKTEKKRACMDAEDCAEAVVGIFLLVIGYFDACGIGEKNALFARRLDGAEDRFPPEYAPLYCRCARLWEEAAYGGRAMGEAQREEVLRLLEATEAQLYDAAGWKTKLRLRMICCLHE